MHPTRLRVDLVESTVSLGFSYLFPFFFRHEFRHEFAMAMAKISWPFFPATFGVRFTGCAGATSVRLRISGQRAFDCSVDIMFSQASSRIAHPA